MTALPAAEGGRWSPNSPKENLSIQTPSGIDLLKPLVKAGTPIIATDMPTKTDTIPTGIENQNQGRPLSGFYFRGPDRGHPSDAQSTDTGSNSGEEVEVNSERDFYATPSVTIYDKYGEASKIYESSDGYWREEDGTAYERIERKVWQLKDSDEIFKIYVWEEGEELTEELDLYSYPSVTVYDDDYNAYKLYEGADGYWREENGTAYERIKTDEFQKKDSDTILYLR